MAAAGAISEGINCIGYLQTLRKDPSVVSAADRDAWCETMAKLYTALEAARKGYTSQPIGDDFLRAIADLRDDLAAVSPGAPLPASTFDRADAAYNAVRTSMMKDA